MTDINIRIINGEKQFQDLVGYNNTVNGFGVSIESWNKIYKELLIVVDGNNNGFYKSEEKISLAFGEKVFIDRLRVIYGFNVIFVNSFSWSESTDRTVRALEYSGFNSVIVGQNGEIEIENNNGARIPALFFTESERDFILKQDNISERTSMSSEKVIPIKNIYLK